MRQAWNPSEARRRRQVEGRQPLRRAETVRQNNGSHVAAVCGHLAQDIHGAAPGRVQTEQQDIGTQLANRRGRSGPVVRFTDDDEPRVGFEQPTETVAKDRLLIGDDDPHRLRWIGTRAVRVSPWCSDFAGALNDSSKTNTDEPGADTEGRATFWREPPV